MHSEKLEFLLLCLSMWKRILLQNGGEREHANQEYTKQNTHAHASNLHSVCQYSDFKKLHTRRSFL